MMGFIYFQQQQQQQLKTYFTQNSNTIRRQLPQTHTLKLASFANFFFFFFHHIVLNPLSG